VTWVKRQLFVRSLRDVHPARALYSRNHGTSELFVSIAAATKKSNVFPGHPLANKMSGNVVDLCPVGALGDKDFLYQQLSGS